jgi:hypothetical protein
VAKVFDINTLILTEKFKKGVVAGFRIPTGSLLFNKHWKVLDLRYSEGGLKFIGN